VELEEERATLITLGVTAAQGYLFGRPAPCSCATPHIEKPAAVAVSA
jgi:EAL domain-containing protein (putative c-di-GMP-specific phosphodiesterase class I)